MKVLGDGPTPARVMFVGEAPGEREDIAGKPFVGRSGEELQRYLRSAGLRREEIYITNLLKFRPPGNADPKPWEIERDEPELVEEIQRVKPEIVVTLGRFAARWFLGEVDMEKVHSLPHKSERTSAWILPIYHPAAGLHSPDTQTDIQFGFERLGEYLTGKLELREVKDEHPNPFYVELTTSLEGKVLDSPLCWEHMTIGVDTEGLSGNPWGLSFSRAAGQGYVMRATHPEALASFNAIIQRDRPLIILHNSLHDLQVLRELGVHLPAGSYVDTMIMAYILCNEPKGLKPLSYRISGMEMMSFPEVVREPSRKIAIQYLRNVVEGYECRACEGTGEIIEIVQPEPTKSGKVRKSKAKVVKCPRCKGDTTAWPLPEPRLVWDAVGGVKEYTPQSIGKRVRKILSDLEAGKDTDPRKRWEDTDTDLRELVEETIGPVREAGLDDVEPQSVAVSYSARDADATLRNYPYLAARIEAMDLGKVLEMDMGIVPMVDRMQEVGFGIDRQHFADLTVQFKEEMAADIREIKRLVGRPVNPASTDQVAALLFGDLHMIPRKKTKGGKWSTDDKVLESLLLQTKHPVIDKITDYRELKKLTGTYSIPLPIHADKSDRIHTSLRITNTDSGRLSSADPNLQNIPTRSERGKLIRAGFVAKPGYLLGSWDLDQIEMRVLAHESGDANLMKVFREGLDIHKMTASLIFRKPIEEITADERSSAKNVGFGIVYGITAQGLKAQMDLRGQERSEAECQAMIDAYLNVAYPGVRDFMADKAAEARRLGYVTDMWGRIRYLPAVHSQIPWVQSEAIRQAGNHPIQAGAQGVIKTIMRRVWNDTLPALHRAGHDVECLLQIHDELIFEFPEGLEDLMDVLMSEVMRTTVKLDVPLGGKGHWGKRWSELK